jgi:hypothetical protein
VVEYDVPEVAPVPGEVEYSDHQSGDPELHVPLEDPEGHQDPVVRPKDEEQPRDAGYKCRKGQQDVPDLPMHADVDQVHPGQDPADQVENDQRDGRFDQMIVHVHTPNSQNRAQLYGPHERGRQYSGPCNRPSTCLY